MSKITNKLARFLKFLYLKLIRINGTPQKIALGLSLGVFTGILPGTGPFAALLLAMLLRVNRSAALLGSIITNTWLSFVTFILAIKIGSFVFSTNWRDLKLEWHAFLKGFTLKGLFNISVIKFILPVLTGYLIISLALGIITYLVTLIVLKTRRKYGNFQTHL